MFCPEILVSVSFFCLLLFWSPKANILLMFVEVVVLFIGVTIFCRVRKSLFFLLVFAKEIINFDKVCFVLAYILRVYVVSTSLIQRQNVKMCTLV